MLLGLPMLGVRMAGLPVARYLQFPPKTRYVSHAPFSWAAFAGVALVALVCVFPFIRQAIRSLGRIGKAAPSATGTPRRFPWWGWMGMALGIAAWVSAWNRFPWFAPFQPHTFTPLWISYVLVINALTFRRTGRCMMVHRTRFFLLLFPVSAAFWWFFEYLNRFVQNWYYVGVEFDAWGYFWYATLPFATVLPAVLGTTEWIRSFGLIDSGFGEFHSVTCIRRRETAWGALVAAALGLTFLFPLLWLSPLVIIVSLKAAMGERHIFSALRGGDWRWVVSSAAAALVCGFFWEMWNFRSLAHWEYAVGFVQQFQIFEMPILGYLGYLPFGMECLVIGDMLGGEYGRTS